MKNLSATLWVEYLKIRRSKVFWLTLLFFAFVPCMFSLIFFVQKYPEIAGKLGMIGSKATMLRFGNADWPNYFTLLNQGFAGIALVGFGFITSWIFGCEYSEHTIKDILALPVSRSYMVISKFLIITFWSFILTCIFLFIGIFCGDLMDIPGWTKELTIENISKLFTVSILSLLLCTPVAFLASYSNGYLLPIGFIILTLIMANFTGLVGLGPYFPWAIPGIFTSPAGTENLHLGMVSYAILFLTGIIGLFGTLAWWQYADQK
jgi:ABC-type transport system involved in multi-copper enzyme maturation permease subunit